MTQLALFELDQRPGPVVHLLELPAAYADAAHGGCRWHWIVSRAHVIYGAGYVATEEEARELITAALERAGQVVGS